MSNEHIIKPEDALLFNIQGFKRDNPTKVLFYSMDPLKYEEDATLLKVLEMRGDIIIIAKETEGKEFWEIELVDK